MGRTVVVLVSYTTHFIRTTPYRVRRNASYFTYAWPPSCTVGCHNDVLQYICTTVTVVNMVIRPLAWYQSSLRPMPHRSWTALGPGRAAGMSGFVL